MYNVTYALKVNDASSLNPSDQLLTVDVTAASGTVMISKNQIYGLSVPSGGEWFNVTFGFGLSLPTRGVEFRGFVDGAYNISFDYVAVKQISPQPINSTDNSFNGS